MIERSIVNRVSTYPPESHFLILIKFHLERISQPLEKYQLSPTLLAWMLLDYWVRPGRTIMKPFISLLTPLVVAFIATSVSAATLTVTKPNDTADGICDVDCSLREAIIAANALNGADKIVLSEGVYKITLSGDDDLGAVGDFDVTTDITIAGPGNDSTNTVISGDLKSRVFDVFVSAVLTLENVTVHQGASPVGAGILVSQDAAILLKDPLKNSM